MPFAVKPLRQDIRTLSSGYYCVVLAPVLPNGAFSTLSCRLCKQTLHEPRVRNFDHAFFCYALALARLVGGWGRPLGGGKSSQICCSMPGKPERKRDSSQEDREDRSPGHHAVSGPDARRGRRRTRPRPRLFRHRQGDEVVVRPAGESNVVFAVFPPVLSFDRRTLVELCETCARTHCSPQLDGQPNTCPFTLSPITNIHVPPLPSAPWIRTETRAGFARCTRPWAWSRPTTALTLWRSARR